MYERHPPSALPDGPLQWARAHPSFFFAGGRVSAESLMEQLLAGARALGSTEVEAHNFDGWFIVASLTDWFFNARFPISEDLQALTPFPELGQNCVRPECVVAAFAREVVVSGPSGTRVVKGTLASSDQILNHIAGAPDWQRAIAFRGLHNA
jgi:hypothetical protein